MHKMTKTKPGMNEIIRAFRRDSADSGFLDCLQVRYKPDMFAQYCLSILRAMGELAAGWIGRRQQLD